MNQNDLDYLKDMMQRNNMTVAEANVEMVRMQRYRIIVNTVPREVRSALNEAVKAKKLAHVKKTKDNPEAYYHPEFEYLLRGEFSRLKDECVKALSVVLTTKQNRP